MSMPKLNEKHALISMRNQHLLDQKIAEVDFLYNSIPELYDDSREDEKAIRDKNLKEAKDMAKIQALHIQVIDMKLKRLSLISRFKKWIKKNSKEEIITEKDSQDSSEKN